MTSIGVKRSRDVNFDPTEVTGVYITTLNDKTFFLVSVELDHDAWGEQLYNININLTPSGNLLDIPISNRESCMYVTVTIDDDNERRAEIEQIQYNKMCAFGGMSKKSGTKSMVKSTMLLCYKLFGVSKFSLRDRSTYLCPQSEDTTSLRDHNLLVYGRSWYERNFGAIPRTPFNWEEYKKRLRQLITLKEVDVLTRVLHRNRNPHVDIIGRTFSKFVGHPWNNAFEDLHLREDCIIFSESFMDVMTNHFDIEPVDQWIIDINPNNSQTLQSKRIIKGDIELL